MSISPNGRFIIGSASGPLDEDGYPAYLYEFILDRSNGQITKLGGPDQPYRLRGINDQGVLSARLNGKSVLYDFISGKVSSIGQWNGSFIGAYDVSNTSVVAAYGFVGGAANPRVVALVGRIGAFEALDLPGEYAVAYGINDAGFAVGFYSADPTTGVDVPYHAFYAVSGVPEPGQAVLLMSGLAAMGLLLRRRGASSVGVA